MGRMQFPTKQPMPGNVRVALEKRNLMEVYLARPPYQKDDYLKGIALAVGATAKQKRLDQMLDDLEKGNSYKGEPWMPAPNRSTSKLSLRLAEAQHELIGAAADAAIEHRDLVRVGGVVQHVALAVEHEPEAATCALTIPGSMRCSVSVSRTPEPGRPHDRSRRRRRRA